MLTITQPKQEKSTKRRNINRWREARFRRLIYEERRNNATAIQVARIRQLEKLILC